MKYSNINIDRTPLTEADFAQGKDFSGVMKAYNQQSPTAWNQSSWFKWGLASVVAVSVVAAAILMVSSNEDVVTEVVPPVVPTEIMEPVESPFIAPPVAELVEDYIIVDVNAEKGGKFALGSSNIEVPPSVFLDDDGNKVKGVVQLKYREYKDKIDLLFSGIPMDYDTAGTTMVFETGGMFELRGEQLGKEIFIAQDQAISVEMKGDDAPGFNTYYLNEDSKKWDYIEPSEIVTEVIDEVSLRDSVQPDIEYYERSMETMEVEIEEPIFPIEDESSIPALVVPKQADPARQHVVMDFPAKLFPELATYSDMLFEVDERSEAFDASKADLPWTNVVVIKGDSTGSYRLEFTRPGERYTVPCYPVFAPGDMANAEQKYNEYQAERERQAEIRRQKVIEQNRLMLEREKQAAQRQAQMTQSQRDSQASWQASASVSRAFQVKNFGIWNCDRPIRYPSVEIFVSNYQNSQGQAITVSNIYLADMKRESLISYDKAIRYDPKSNNMLWGITSDNQLAIANTDDLKDAKCQRGGCTVTMKVHPEPIKNASDARKIINQY
jgi:hypothetical protein